MRNVDYGFRIGTAQNIPERRRSLSCSRNKLPPIPRLSLSLEPRAAVLLRRWLPEQANDVINSSRIESSMLGPIEWPIGCNGWVLEQETKSPSAAIDAWRWWSVCSQY